MTADVVVAYSSPCAKEENIKLDLVVVCRRADGTVGVDQTRVLGPHPHRRDPCVGPGAIVTQWRVRVYALQHCG